MPVVLLPVKGSSTHAPGRVEARMMRDKTASGFWQGCLPHDFSHGAMAGRRHTSPHLLAVVDALHQLVIVIMGYFG